MFRTPYETTVCKDYVVDRIAAAIAEVRAMGNPPLERLEKNPLSGKELETLVLMVRPDHTSVPSFAHPFFIEEESMGEKEYLPVIDVRNFTRISRNEEMTVSSHLDYKHAGLRALLSHYWLTENAEDFLSLGYFQVTVFARWLTDVITRRLALPVDAQVRLTVITAFYYLCLFQEDEELDEKRKMQMVRVIGQATYASTDIVTEVVDQLNHLKSINDYIEAVKEVGQSVRLESLNLGLLTQITGGSWFGSNHREMIAVALEHPPTFISILGMAIDERGYRRTMIGKTIEMAAKKGADRSFLYNLQRMPL